MFSKQGFKKYFANTSWLIAEKVFNLAIAFSVGIYVARYLGPEDFGLRSYVQSFVGLFAVFATLGIEQIVIRDLVKGDKETSRLLGTAFFLQMSGAGLVFALLFIVAFLFKQDTLTNILIFIFAATTIFQSFNIIDYYFQAKVKSKFVVYCKTAQTIISALTKLYLIFIKASLLWFVIALSFDAFVLSVGLIIVYLKQKNHISSWRFDPAIAIKLFKSSWPLILSGVMVSIYMKIDQVMIKNMLDNKAVGNYAAAVRISEAWYFIPIVIASSLFPAIINAKKKSQELYYSRLQGLYDLMACLALGIALVFTFFSKHIILFLYGQPFIEAAGALQIHIWAGIFVFLGVATGKYLIAEDYTKIAFFRTFMGMVINIILNFYMIPRYGIKGAAFATLISQFVSLYSLIFIPKTYMNMQLIFRSMLVYSSIPRLIRGNYG